MRSFFTLLFALVLSIKAVAQPFDSALAEELQHTIDSMQVANAIQGISACVMLNGGAQWNGVTGFSHAGQPITPDMEFGIASNTKLFTGVLILRLAETGILQMSDSIHEYLPAMNNIDSTITIRQLLHMVSGLADVADVVGYGDSILSDPNRIFSPEEFITWVGPPIYSAGDGWNYCNTNYHLLGMIAESATGQSYGQLIHEYILDPLQLDSTFVGVYDSVLYTVAHPWQAGVDNFFVPRKALNSAAWAAGAMYSTAGEMAQWYQALMSGQVLQADALAEMTTFVGSGNYGLGISRANVLGRTVWQHGGTIWGGYNSFMLYDTGSGAVICVLINQLPGQALQVAVQLLSVLLNNPVSSTEDLPAAAASRLYPNPAGDIVTVEVPGRQLLRIQVFGADGQLLLASVEARFSVAALPPGVYFLQVQTTDGGGDWQVLVKE